MDHLELTTDNFDAELTKATTPVIVDFWAPWCGPCKVMSPIVEDIARTTPGLTVGKVNVDDHPALAQRFNILSIPTFIVFSGGSVKEQFAGSMSKEAMLVRLQKYLSQ